MLLFFFEMLVVGVVVGLMNGALGIGGGILMVPAMLEFVPGMAPHTAKGTSLFIIIFVAGVNAWRQNRGRPVAWDSAGLLAAGSIVGGYTGAWFTSLVTGETVIWIFVGLLGLIVVRLLFSEPRPVFAGKPWQRVAMAVGIGLATGVTSGMTGIGGGLVLVPLALLTRISTNERVTGLSNLVMVATSAAAVTVHFRVAPEVNLPLTVGQVSLAVAPWIFLGSQIGSPLGRYVNTRLTYSQRRAALVIVIVVIGARMVWRALA
ncbi:MAG TPA: sulfite exporter TauE/SafE family protein [Candidatus Bathyarchaeia archaeon]|nr:sulfite exporter TauE/SafE family protein [Candidatus Bathyarchaeia archaeon]